MPIRLTTFLRAHCARAFVAALLLVGPVTSVRAHRTLRQAQDKDIRRGPCA